MPPCAVSQVLRNFCVIRKLNSNHPWPLGFEAAAAAENAGPRGRANGGSMVQLTGSERLLLVALLNRMVVGAAIRPYALKGSRRGVSGFVGKGGRGERGSSSSGTATL